METLEVYNQGYAAQIAALKGDPRASESLKAARDKLDTAQRATFECGCERAMKDHYKRSA